MTKATLVEQMVTVYADPQVRLPMAKMPGGSEVDLFGVVKAEGRESVSVRLADGRRGYLPGETEIRIGGPGQNTGRQSRWSLLYGALYILFGVALAAFNYFRASQLVRDMPIIYLCPVILGVWGTRLVIKGILQSARSKRRCPPEKEGIVSARDHSRW